MRIDPPGGKIKIDPPVGKIDPPSGKIDPPSGRIEPEPW